MTTPINVRRAFSYSLNSGSINYTRNYNFNSTTVTTLRLTMNNSGSTLPLTVQLSASVPWIRITDPVSGQDITYPTGSIVLQPSSSRFVNLLVDLPPSIEAVTDRDIYLYPDIHMRVLSGSVSPSAQEPSPTGSSGGGSGSGPRGTTFDEDRNPTEDQE